MSGVLLAREGHVPQVNNVKNVVLHNWGAWAQGFPYRITYALSGKPSELDAEILEYHPPARLAIRLTRGRFSRTDYVYETYELIPMDGATRPLLFRILIWFVRRFGKSTGKSYLAGVKALAEGSIV